MKREKWIDICKAIAILAVIINHSYGSLFHSIKLNQYSLFSVSLFIFLMGVTLGISYSRTGVQIGRKVLRGICKILIAYVPCVIVFDCFRERSFDLIRIAGHVVRFDASGPHYYVLLYIQLMIISPVLYKWLKTASDRSKVWRSVMITGGMMIIVLFSIVSVKMTFIAEVYGGARYLFGGTYLIELYLGLILGVFYPAVNERVSDKRIRFAGLSISTVCIIGLMCYLWKNGYALDQKLLPQAALNPPGITLILYAGVLMIWIFFLVKSGESSVLTNGFLKHVSVIGQHTLYIFLYHLLFPDLILPYFENRILRILIYLPVMICGPIVIEWIAGRVKTRPINIYSFREI